MFARGERQAFNRKHALVAERREITDRTTQEKDWTSYPYTPSVPASALQKSTGRSVMCVKGIRDV